MNTSLLPHILFLEILSLSFIVLSIWMFRTYLRSQSITYYSSFLLSLGILAFVSGTLLVIQTNDNLLLFFTRLGYMAGAVTAVMFFMFTLYYPLPNKHIPAKAYLFWLVPMVFFIPFIFINNEFVRDVVLVDGLPKEITGKTYFVLPIFISVYFILSLKNLLQKLSLDPTRKKQVIFVIFAVLLAGGGSITLDVILPGFGIRSPHYISQELSVLIFGMTTFIVLRK